jgi:hypothetical protein
MSHELAKIPEVEGLVKYSAEQFSDLVKSGKFFKRIQLYGGNSLAVKQGKFPIAHYGVTHTKDSIEDLGAEFDLIPFSWRPKAIKTSGEDLIVEYDENSDRFKAIMIETEQPDSGCMYGPDFLIYVPKLKGFFTIFFSNPTMRRESPNMIKQFNTPTTLKCHLIERKKYSWHGPLVINCSTPLTHVPTREEVIAAAENFNALESTIIQDEAPASERSR